MVEMVKHVGNVLRGLSIHLVTKVKFGIVIHYNTSLYIYPYIHNYIVELKSKA